MLDERTAERHADSPGGDAGGWVDAGLLLFALAGQSNARQDVASLHRDVLAARIAGPEVAQAIQLGIEYDPQPPFDAGSTEKAAPEIVELVRAVAAARRGEEAAAQKR